MRKSRSRRNSGGRQGRIEMRQSEEVVFDPAPPGPIGGQYQPLSERELQAIYDTALRLLHELGMGEVPKALRKQCEACGATTLENGRVSFPPSMVDGIVKNAAKTVRLWGADQTR